MPELDPSTQPEIIDQAGEVDSEASRSLASIRELDDTIAQVQSFGFLAMVGGSDETRLALVAARAKIQHHFDELNDTAAPVMAALDSPFSTDQIAVARADELSLELPRQLG